MVKIDQSTIPWEERTYQDKFDYLTPADQEVIIDEEISRANSIAKAIDRIIASWSNDSHQKIADFLIF